MSRTFGPVAQLGERRVRIAEAEGSNPFGSTMKSTENICFRCFFSCFRRLLDEHGTLSVNKSVKKQFVDRLMIVASIQMYDLGFVTLR